jgi:xanthine dehydrogenase accessory factor
MKEVEDIIRSYKNAVQQNKKTALATVVHVEGSSYRRPGARMLVTEDGELTGAISGGCLEGDALRKALLAINQQQNKLVAYDSMDEDDNSIGIQLGCNGIVYILFEPIDAAKKDNPIALLTETATRKSNAVLVTLFSLANNIAHPGTCLSAIAGNYSGNIPDEILDSSIKEEIEQVITNNRSTIKNYVQEDGKLISAFIELIKPPVELFIAGAGNDTFPLVDMANILGWHVSMIDGRKTHATANRFPSAKKIIVAKPTDAAKQIVLNEQSVFVLMSHNYNYDIGMLKELITSKCNYIGVLGPKTKLEKMMAELTDQGLAVTDEMKQKIYGPVGLDIGAETAEEIALSITAEIKTVLSKKNAATLRDKSGFIHEHHITAKLTAE